MILYRGELCEDRELPRLLERLEADCLETIAGQSIDRETVVAACDALACRVEAGDYDSVLQPFLAAFSIDPARFREALFLFKREALSYKLAVELGPEDLPDLTPPGRAPIRRGGCLWGCCSTWPPETWTACPPTAWWRACWRGTSTF